MMENVNFLFRDEWDEAMTVLSIIDSKEAYGFDEKDLLHAIVNYALRGERVPYDEECGLRAMMALIYPRIDEDRKLLIAIRERSRGK